MKIFGFNTLTVITIITVVLGISGVFSWLQVLLNLIVAVLFFIEDHLRTISDTLTKQSKSNGTGN
jgi:hypothetical protein